MDQLHDHHIKIISNFIFKTEAEQADMDFTDIPDQEVESYLNSLIEHGYLLINDDKKFSLTSKGKDVAGRLDFETSKIEKQPKTVMAAICRKNENGVEKFLMHIRKEHPYYDFLGFPTGTAKFGNVMETDVVRELEEEAGLRGTPLLKEIKHMLVRTRDTGEVMDDVMMYSFEIINVEGELIESTPEGENKWMTIEEIRGFDKVMQNTWDTIEAMKRHGVVFSEEIQEYDSL